MGLGGWKSGAEALRLAWEEGGRTARGCIRVFWSQEAGIRGFVLSRRWPPAVRRGPQENAGSVRKVRKFLWLSLLFSQKPTFYILYLVVSLLWWCYFIGCDYNRLEHGVYNLSRMRESATKRYKVFHIPTDWMLDAGYVSQVHYSYVFRFN